MIYSDRKVRITEAGKAYWLEATEPIFDDTLEPEYYKGISYKSLRLLGITPDDYISIEDLRNYYIRDIGTDSQFRKSLKGLFEAGYIEFSNQEDS